jgi:hypothetical protein
MKLRTLLFGLIAAFATAGSSAAWAQAQPVTGLDASGTITATGTYQTLQIASIDRRGCLIENNGTHSMSVKIGLSVWIVAAGLSISCNNGDLILVDAVSITGTAGDAFTASFQ